MRIICRYYVPEVRAICPKDGTTDTYALAVESDHMIEVEKLLRVIDECTAEPAYQESITEMIADEVRAQVRSEGYHIGVRTVCIVYPKDSG